MIGANLDTTFRFLAETENEAATDVLIAGLDCPSRAIRHVALRTLLQRRSPAGHREVFRRFRTLDKPAKRIVRERPDRLIEAASEALRSPDRQECAAACNAIVSFRLYDALPTLVAALADAENAHSAMLARVALKLTELFYAELSGVDDPPKRKGQENVRLHVTAALEEAVRKFHRHRRPEVLEALLLLAKTSNVTLRQLLQRPHESSYRPLVRLLHRSSRGGVLRFLLGFIEDPRMPRVIAKVLGSRCDLKFVDHLLRTVASRPSKTMAEALARLDSIAWAQPGHRLFRQLDGLAQQGAVQLLLASSIDRPKLLEMIGYLLLEGETTARRAAAQALAKFDEAEASALVVKGLQDEDPRVRAHLLVQLRPRRIPGAMSTLIRMIDSTDEEIRRALRTTMPEFTLQQFLPNFDALPEELRTVAGHLVKKLDEDARTEIIGLMHSPSPVRRRRAVEAAAAMGLVPDVESTVVKLLSDEDHLVRAAAAKALAEGKSMPAWDALRDALLDRSVIVKEAAEQSLQQISQSLVQPTEQEKEEMEEAAP